MCIRIIDNKASKHTGKTCVQIRACHSEALRSVAARLALLPPRCLLLSPNRRETRSSRRRCLSALVQSQQRIQTCPKQIRAAAGNVGYCPVVSICRRGTCLPGFFLIYFLTVQICCELKLNLSVIPRRKKQRACEWLIQIIVHRKCQNVTVIPAQIRRRSYIK